MSSKKLNEDSYHHYATPTSTLSSGYGNYGGGFVHEDNLPEVRIDNSPQALSNPEAEFKRKYFEESEPKYPAIYDNAPKTVVLEEVSPPSAPTTTAGERAPQQTLAENRKILGLKRRVFFILLVVVLVIIAISVGAGVGTAMSSKSKSNTKASTASAPGVSTASSPSSSIQAPAIASQSSTVTTTSSISTVTKSSSHPSSTSSLTFLNNQTTPSSSFAFQGFTAASYLGNATSIIHSEGGTDFPFELNSYVWLPNTTACCLSFCVNATNAGLGGWWCDERYQPSASAPFGRIFVWCGEPRTQANAVCV
ncbi:hypothetical protein N431DRAFT_561161 [Stipitochalara longipes BDJ]|nr:hypothetical protein N431DRAFT_561161 [Stipitochalara longipes BDJ]